MSLAIPRLEKEPAKLRKSVKKLRRDVAADDVHNLRTRARRFEAIIHALALQSTKNGRRLLKSVKPVRKKAGNVRDIDVFMEFVISSKLPDEEQCAVQLVEYLGGCRDVDARKLSRTARRLSPEVKQRTRKFDTLFAAELRTKNGQRDWGPKAAARALQLENELRNWPNLNRKNIHPFRLKVKELRYVLQMAEKDSDFIRALGDVKDAIGEWHDWQELARIAADISHHSGCKLVQQFRSTSNDKYGHALAIANRIRSKELRTTRDRKILPSIKKTARSAEPAIVSATALAA